MSSHRPRSSPRGPFRADGVRVGDPYELSDGHAIYCNPTAGRGGSAQAFGASVILNDPAARSGGVDVGFSPRPDMLRAPDIAVGNVPDEPGWVAGVPPLAVEYSDTGQDEAVLQDKIQDLLQAGTKLIWVVRLAGPRRVEIYEADKPMRVALPGEQLEAPGILQNQVRVEALYDPEAAREATLRNLLQRAGYESLDEVRAEGEMKGRAEGETSGRAEGERRLADAAGRLVAAGMTVEQAAEVLKLDVEIVRRAASR